MLNFKRKKSLSFRPVVLFIDLYYFFVLQIKRGKNMQKKRNMLNCTLTNEAIVVLQVLGYMDKNKKIVPGKNASKFVSRLICDFVATNYPDKTDIIKERLIKQEVGELNREVDQRRKKIEFLAIRIAAINSNNEVIQEMKE